MDYDTWKLMTPEEDSAIVQADIKAGIGVWITLDEYKEITITLQVPVEKDWDDDKEDIIISSHIHENVMEYMNQKFPDYKYGLLN